MADPRSTLPGLTPSYIEVSYGGQVLLPSPLINHQVSIERDDAGDRETITTTRTLTGSILTLGMGYHLVRQKQRELEETFSVDNLEFKIVATEHNPCIASGTAIESGVFPTVASITINEDIHVNRLDYTVVLEDVTAPSGVSGVVQNLTNSWSFSENDDTCVIDIVHSVSAQGINTATGGGPSNALDNAVARVKSLVGLANAPKGFPGYAQPASGTDSRFYELTTSREESLDVEDATYSVNETFRLVSGLHPFIDNRNSSYSVDEAGVVTVTLDGTIQGYGRTNDGPAAGIQRGGGGTGFANALSGFTNLVQPQLGVDANTIYARYGGSGSLAIQNPQSQSIGEDPCGGVVTYSVTYTDDPAENLPSGIIELTCTVQRNDPVVNNAIINVPFNALGPVFQRLCSTSEGTYTISCNAVARNTGNEVVDTNRAIEVVEQNIIERQPNPADYVQLRLTGRDITTDRLNRSANVTYTWTFSQSIDTVPSDDGPISLGRIS